MKAVNILLNTVSRVWFVGGDYHGHRASLSTSALLFVIGAAPAVVMTLIRAGAPSQSVAGILRFDGTRLISEQPVTAGPDDAL